MGFDTWLFRLWCHTVVAPHVVLRNMGRPLKDDGRAHAHSVYPTIVQVNVSPTAPLKLGESQGRNGTIQARVRIDRGDLPASPKTTFSFRLRAALVGWLV
jgi:hypothetical protein